MPYTRGCDHGYVMWILAFLSLSLLFVHNQIASLLGVDPYLTFWAAFLAGLTPPFYRLVSVKTSRREAVPALAYVILLSSYLLLLRQVYAAASPFFGLDTYFDVGAVRLLQTTGFAPGSATSTPLQGIVDFPTVHFLAVEVISVANLGLLQTVSSLSFFLSALSTLFFFLAIRQRALPWSARVVLVLAFTSTNLFLQLYFGRQMLGLVLFLAILYWIVRDHKPSIEGSLVLVLLIVALVPAHQISAPIELLVMIVFSSVANVTARRLRAARPTSSGPRSDAMLLLATVLFAYWLIVTLSVPALLAKVGYVLSNPGLPSSGGFHFPLRAQVGIVLLLSTLGGISLFVLNIARTATNKRLPETSIALVLSAGILFVVSFALVPIGVPLDLIRFLLFIQPLVLIGLARSPGASILSRRIAVPLMVAVVIANMLILPPYLSTPAANPDYAHGEIRLFVLPSELRAIAWLPRNQVALGDHYFLMAGFYNDDYSILVNQSLIANPMTTPRPYQWYLYDTGYSNRILDRLNYTYSTLSAASALYLNLSPDFNRVYDNGNVKAFLVEG